MSKGNKVKLRFRDGYVYMYVIWAAKDKKNPFVDI